MHGTMILKPNKNTGFTHLQIEWNPWLGGYRAQILVLSALCPQLNLLNTPPPRKNSWRNPPSPKKISGYATDCVPASGPASITNAWTKIPYRSFILYDNYRVPLGASTLLHKSAVNSVYYIVSIITSRQQELTGSYQIKQRPYIRNIFNFKFQRISL
jgi:hypothetical protein